MLTPCDRISDVPGRPSVLAVETAIEEQKKLFVGDQEFATCCFGGNSLGCRSTAAEMKVLCFSLCRRVRKGDLRCERQYKFDKNTGVHRGYSQT
jgi:hypothetical protein